MTLDDWLAMQFNSLAVMALGILVHVTLHWNWVCGVIFSRRKGAAARDKPPRLDSGAQTLYGVGMLVVLANVVGVAVAAATLWIQAPPR